MLGLATKVCLDFEIMLINLLNISLLIFFSIEKFSSNKNYI